MTAKKEPTADEPDIPIVAADLKTGDGAENAPYVEATPAPTALTVSSNHPSNAPVAARIPNNAQPPSSGDEQIKPEEWETTFGPRNRWKHGLCQCFDICCSPLCLMACCGWTRVVVFGQLAERMGLTWLGNYDPSEAKASTCSIISIIWLVYLCCCFMGFGFIAWPFFFVWSLIVFTRIRAEIRMRHGIPPEYCSCCDGVFEDCLCTHFCTCCTAIQMARQTHNEDKYLYHYSSSTGLPTYAPVIYEQPPAPGIVDPRNKQT